MDQSTAQSIIVVMIGVGLWLFLLDITQSFLGSVGVTLLAFGVMSIISRVLLDPDDTAGSAD